MAALTALLLAACGPGDGTASPADPGEEGEGSATEAAQPRPVRLGILPAVATVPVYMGLEQGFFADHGIELEVSTGQGGSAILPAVISGDLQFGFSNVVTLMAAREQGLDVRMVVNGSLEQEPDNPPEVPQNVLIVAADSPIATAADLSGRTVAVNTLENAVEVTTRAAIDNAGGDSGAIVLVEMGMGDMPAALAAGHVDAINVVEPFTTIALSQGGQALLAPFTEPLGDPAASIANYFASGDLVTGDPELVADFVAAMGESFDYAQANPELVRDAVVEHMEMDPDLAAVITLPYWTASFNVDSIIEVGLLAQRYGKISEDPDLDLLLPECANNGTCVVASE